MVLQLTEILSAEPEERGAVHLGRTADKVVRARLKGLSLGVVPRVFRDIAPLDEDLVHVPVLLLPGKKIAALEQQNLFPRRREPVRERAAARACADDDHIELFS